MTLPKPDARIAPTADEFESWALHPVSRYVAAAFERRAKDLQTQWLAETWHGGDMDGAEMELKRRVLVTRTDAYLEFLTTTWSDYVAVNTQDQ